jgi:hypothetical protein
VNLLHGSKGVKHRHGKLRVASPGTTRKELLRDTLPGAVAVVVGTAREPSLSQRIVNGASIRRRQVWARNIRGLVEAEPRGPIEAESHAAQAHAARTVPPEHPSVIHGANADCTWITLPPRFVHAPSSEGEGREPERMLHFLRCCPESEKKPQHYLWTVRLIERRFKQTPGDSHGARR